MRSHLAITAILALALTASTLQVESTPFNGITGLQELPSTGKGQLFGACFNEMLKKYGSSEQTLHDIRVNKTVAPIDVRLDGHFAEQVATQLTDSQVDEFCAAATNPTMARAVQAMEQAKASAGAKARIEWQASVKNSAKQPKSPASNVRTADSGAMPGAKPVLPPATALNPSTIGNSSSAAANGTNMATATSSSRPTPTRPASFPTPAAKPKGAARPAAGFDAPYSNDPASGLFLPHPAEYSPVEGGYAVLYTPLVNAGLYPNTSNGDIRSNSSKVATAVLACAALDVTSFVVSVVCGLTGTTGAWAGACALAAAGGWTAPAEIVCLAAQAVTGTAFSLCNQVVTGIDFVDNEVDGGEIQAAYENGKKALDNHVILWNKADADTTYLWNKADSDTTRLDTQIKATEAALSTQIAEALATITALVKDLATVTNSQICDLKTDVAQVQRETDYLRRLLLTPEPARPGFNCPFLTASRTPLNACDVRCPMVRPNACLAVDIKNVVPARLSEPMPFCQ